MPEDIRSLTEEQLHQRLTDMGYPAFLNGWITAVSRLRR